MLGGYLSDLEAGDVFEPVRYTLTSLIVDAYLLGIEEDAEWFSSAENPSGRQMRPPTMVHVEKMRLFEVNCPLEARASGTSHPEDARMQYEYSARHRSAAYVGEELVVTGRVADRYLKRGREFLRFEVEVRTAEGRLVTEYSDRLLLRFRLEGQDAAAS